MASLSVPRRRLGRTELSIPVVPFGTLGFSNQFGFVSDEDAVALIKHAISLGVNHFDGARCYGDSLRKLALAMKEIPRKDVIITGRVCCHSGAEWGGYGEGTPDYSAERVVADVEDQLQWLEIDYFDGVLIHDPVDIEPTLKKGGTLEGLLRCKTRRLTKFAGYGMGPHDFHLKAIATGDVDFILTFNDYNLIRQTAAERILPATVEADVGVMNGWSILRGLLTGIDLEAAAAGERWKNSPDLEPARARWKWYMEKEIDMLQLAIQFCLRDERIHGNNIGSLNIQQLESNVRAASTPLPDGVWEEYDARFGNDITT